MQFLLLQIWRKDEKDMFCKCIQIAATSPGSRFTSCESEEVLVPSSHFAGQKLAEEGAEEKENRKIFWRFLNGTEIQRAWHVNMPAFEEVFVI